MMNEDKNNYDEEDRLYYEGLSQTETPVAKQDSTLPKVVEQYVTSAVEVSKYNEVPAAMSFYVLLGQLVKDMVAIPQGRRLDDTRIQFIWMQTSGTGKSTLYDFFGPVSRETFQIINEKYGTNFDIFSVKDTTDAALIGSMEKVQETIADEDEPPRTVWIPQQIDGALEGDGLAAYDEFEYSGVFKQSQHKENVIMYLNTFMNSLHGENWIITKKLKDGDTIECRCRRSLFATTYIPKALTNVIAEKGVMQRTVIYIKEIPQEVQEELREQILDEVGIIKSRDTPIKKFAENFVIIYDNLREHYISSGEDPLRTVKFGRGYIDALKNESWKLSKYATDSRPEVLEIAANFVTRMNQTMIKLSVLCCIAEAPNIKNKERRFIVTERHARQASSIIRQCYKSLVSWLDVALKVKTQALHERVGVNAFKKAYSGLLKKGDDGWVNKALLLSKVREQTKKGQTTVYRNFNEISHMFDNKKIGVRAYLKLKEENKNE